MIRICLSLFLAAARVQGPSASSAPTFSSATAEAPFGTKPLLPDSLIVTYYGNPLSKKMGILGEFPPKQMMDKLDAEAKLWQKADSSSTVRPGLELVADVASDHPQPDGKYHVRMAPSIIEKVMAWARSRGWLIILDIQVGKSTVAKELDWAMPWLESPDVHLALDPEFQMHGKLKPGQRIGSADAEDVNLAVIRLARLVAKKKLPQKLLIVHRFTDDMLKRYKKVRLDPNVHIVIVMDGYGEPFGKRKIYRREITREPVQFAGIKLFYKNDKPMLTRKEVLELEPKPRVVIYQQPKRPSAAGNPLMAALGLVVLSSARSPASAEQLYLSHMERTNF